MAVMEDDIDRQGFVDLLAAVIERSDWRCYAYCLMDNHYHLLIETPEADLSRGMPQLAGVYTQRFNRRHGRVGHLVQGRFKAILVDQQASLLELSRYVVLHPVRAGMVPSADRYRWSSYRVTAGRCRPPTWLQIDWVLAQFGRRRAAAHTRYRQFVREGVANASPWGALQGQVVLGGEGFLEQLAPLLQGSADLREIPLAQRRADRPALATVFNGVHEAGRAERNRRIREAHLVHGYTLEAIGDHLGLHYATISRIVIRQMWQDKT
jgi:REP element-mobilizing transposase RayT